ncbi:hypothetical protein ACFWE5_07230 [Cellulosimicrobium funkei]|uniref:hypothetical protein n=1 Tax=Cellulosimicrobium funkei TaxID=264251 RepID=UPI00364C9BBF
MAQHDTDAEVVEAVRSTIDDLFGRFLGQLTGAGEAVEFVEALQRKGVLVVLDADVPETPVLEAGPLVTVNLNVSTTPEQLPEVLDRLREHGLPG